MPRALHGYNHPSARFQDAPCLGQRLREIDNMQQRADEERGVKMIARKRKLLGPPAHHARPRLGVKARKLPAMTPHSQQR